MRSAVWRVQCLWCSSVPCEMWNGCQAKFPLWQGDFHHLLLVDSCKLHVCNLSSTCLWQSVLRQIKTKLAPQGRSAIFWLLREWDVTCLWSCESENYQVKQTQPKQCSTLCYHFWFIKKTVLWWSQEPQLRTSYCLAVHRSRTEITISVAWLGAKGAKQL